MPLHIYQDTAGEYRWSLTADNGEVIADSSEGYTERNDCAEAAVRVAREFDEEIESID